MANELETSLVLKLTGNIDQQAARYSRSIDQMSRSSSRSLGIMRGSVSAMGKGLDMMGNRYTALLTGGGLAAMTHQVGNFDAVMVRLGTNVGLSTDQVKQWKAEIQNVANASDIRIDKGAMADAVDALLSKTGDIKFTEKNIRNLGLAIQGFGADANSVGALVAQMWEKNIRGSGEVEAFYDRLFDQFARGSLSVAEIARISPKLLSLTQNQGPQAAAELTGLAQIFVKTTGSADEAATSIASVMKTFSNPVALKFFQGKGIKVFQDDGKTLRPLNLLLREIVERAGESEINLRQVFTSDESLKGLRALLMKENRDLYDEMVNGTVQLGRTQRAAAENANTFKASLQSLTNAMEKFADKKLSKPTKNVADFVNGGSQARQDQVADDLWNAGMVVAGAYGARKLWNVVPGSLKKKMAMNIGLARILPTVSAGAFATAGITAGAQVGGAGYAAYHGTGWLMRMSGLQDKLSRSDLGDAYGRGWARVLAALGNDNAQSTLQSERNAKLTLAFDMNGAPFVKSADTNGFDVNVEAGGGLQ